MGKKSTVAKATSKSDSVRATIPEEIAKEMGLRIGDVLDWELVTEGKRKVVKVKKLE
jgi:bifunctional DNA-binding transcriptional regulator/antitoxin component of YhaV-PrlF toxin-antitoxin module